MKSLKQVRATARRPLVAKQTHPRVRERSEA